MGGDRGVKGTVAISPNVEYNTNKGQQLQHLFEITKWNIIIKWEIRNTIWWKKKVIIEVIIIIIIILTLKLDITNKQWLGDQEVR